MTETPFEISRKAYKALVKQQAALKESHIQLVRACEAQCEAIDHLFARLIELDRKFLPSESGQPWAALVQGGKAILHSRKLEGTK